MDYSHVPIFYHIVILFIYRSGIMVSSWQLFLLFFLNCIIATTLMNTCISLFPPNMSDCGAPPVTKYYYSANSRTCVPFTYRGCIDLISITFDSLQECQSECIEGQY